MANPAFNLLTRFGVWSASPFAFAIVVVYGVVWVIFDRQSFNWHALATLATWTMTLFIQRAEHRDTQAIQAKLDELLSVQSDARSQLTRIDEREPEEIEKFRDQQRTSLSSR